MGRELFRWHLICQVPPCWSWDVEKRINVCESSSVQDTGQKWFKVQSRREKGRLGLELWQHEENQDTSWWCVTNAWSWEFTGL